MGRYAGPDSQASLLADIERRLAALESSPSAQQTSIKEGLFQILDAGKNAVVSLGRQIASGRYGLVMTDINYPGVELVTVGNLDIGGSGIDVKASNGYSVFRVNAGTGQDIPYPVVELTSPLNYQRINTTTGAGVYIDVWKGLFKAVAPNLAYDFLIDDNGAPGVASFQMIVSYDFDPTVYVAVDLPSFSSQQVVGTLTLASIGPLSNVLGHAVDLRLRLRRPSGAAQPGIAINTPPYLTP